MTTFINIFCPIALSALTIVLIYVGKVIIETGRELFFYE